MAHSSLSADSLSSGSEILEDKFGKLLKFSEEVAPVFEDLTGEQKERRLLDFVRNLNIVRHLNSTNDQLDIAASERRESDVLLEKLNRFRDVSYEPFNPHTLRYCNDKSLLLIS
jgi:hypothetical protein